MNFLIIFKKTWVVSDYYFDYKNEKEKKRINDRIEKYKQIFIENYTIIPI